MECIQCGAELRLGARFCNVCGAEQPPMTAEAETDSQAGDSAGKQKRPPRIPRHRDDETDDSNGADDSPDDHAKMQPEPAASEELDSAVVAVAVAEQPEAESEPVPAVAHADAVPVDKSAEDDGDD